MNKIISNNTGINFLGYKKAEKETPQTNSVYSLKTLTQDTVSFKARPIDELNKEAMLYLLLNEIDEYNRFRQDNKIFRPDFHKKNLNKMSLERANFKEAYLEYTKFQESHLENAIFVKANLYGSNFKGAFLKGADFRYADLRSANLLNTDLEGAKFRYAQYNSKTKFPKDFDPIARGLINKDYQTQGVK